MTARVKGQYPSKIDETHTSTQDAIDSLHDRGFVMRTTRNSQGNIEMARYSRPIVDHPMFILYGDLPDEIVEIRS